MFVSISFFVFFVLVMYTSGVDDLWGYGNKQGSGGRKSRELEAWRS